MATDKLIHKLSTALSHHFDGSDDVAFQPAVFIFDQKEVSELENLNDVRLVPRYPLCNVSPDQVRIQAPPRGGAYQEGSRITGKRAVGFAGAVGRFYYSYNLKI